MVIYFPAIIYITIMLIIIHNYSQHIKHDSVESVRNYVAIVNMHKSFELLGVTFTISLLRFEPGSSQKHSILS